MIVNEFTVAPELRGVTRLGLIEIDGVTVRETPQDLKSLFEELSAAVVEQFVSVAPAEIPRVKAVRNIFHKAGIDPTRYRPSSESLLRRVVKKKGLYFINSAVDAVNYCSLKSLLPMGLYAADRIQSPVSFRVGIVGETYEGIGRDVLNLTNFPVLADSEGPFGSPISDSMRTRVDVGCSRLLWITFAPTDIDLPLDEFAELLIRFNGGEVRRTTQL